MTILRRVVFALALAAPMLIASQPASATGSCITVTKWGVGLSQGMAATKAQWLLGAKRSLWMTVKPRGYVNAGPMHCNQKWGLYKCKVRATFCK